MGGGDEWTGRSGLRVANNYCTEAGPGILISRRAREAQLPKSPEVAPHAAMLNRQACPWRSYVKRMRKSGCSLLRRADGDGGKDDRGGFTNVRYSLHGIRPNGCVTG